MDTNKLKEAAIDYSTYTDSDDYDVTMYNAFKDGANWLMQQPLSERLTDEEKEKIYGYLRSIIFVYAGGQYPSLEAIKDMLIDIFGKELFN